MFRLCVILDDTVEEDIGDVKELSEHQGHHLVGGEGLYDVTTISLLGQCVENADNLQGDLRVNKHVLHFTQRCSSS